MRKKEAPGVGGEGVNNLPKVTKLGLEPRSKRLQSPCS